MLQGFSDWITYKIFVLEKGSHIAESLNFFIYDTIKILILLALIIFCISFFRSYLPPEKVRSFLSKKNKYIGNVLAALFGIVTPFCTCSAISLFLGFLEAGVPLGVTFSFLVASPMINEVAIILLFGLFGWKIAVLYIVSGLIIAIISGIIIGELRMENLVEDFVTKGTGIKAFAPKMVFKERLIYARNYMFDMLKKVWIYIVIGIGFGALMHGYVPADFMAQYASADKWYAVPVATIIGIPLYSNAAGVLPLVSVLTEKGVSMGTALAFMMAVTGLSLPEFMILKRVMKLKLIGIFAGIVAVGIIFTGYLFNLVL